MYDMLDRTPGFWSFKARGVENDVVKIEILDEGERNVLQGATLGDFMLMTRAPLLYDLLWDALAIMDAKDKNFSDPQIRENWRKSVIGVLALTYVLPHQGDEIEADIPQYLIEEVGKKFIELYEPKNETEAEE